VSQVCSKKFHIRGDVPIHSPAFLLKEGSAAEMSPDELRGHRHVPTIPVTPRLEQLELETFHPGREALSGWVQGWAKGPHSTTECCVIFKGLCVFDDCPYLKYYELGALIPSNLCSEEPTEKQLADILYPYEDPSLPGNRYP
jgi:hypothetical protein